MKKRYSLVFSLFFAANGLWQIIKEERNIKIHLSVALGVTLFGFILGIDRDKWLTLILIIFMVLVAEIFNSTIEKICDLLKEKLNLGYQETRDIRNISAGAVLLLAIGAVVTGLIIFFPYLKWLK